MVAQYIRLGKGDWNVLIYYMVSPSDFLEIEDSLLLVGCPLEEIEESFEVLKKKNTGLTFSNTDYKMSVVCISETTSVDLFVNTVIHEAKHVQSHICEYYNIAEDSERAAYLIGYLVQRMYKMFAKFVKRYV